MEHSDVVGGSTAARRMACHGSRALEAAAPPEAPSTYAAKGTALHNAMEKLVNDVWFNRRLSRSEAVFPVDFNLWKDEETGITLAPPLNADGSTADSYESMVRKNVGIIVAALK